MLSSFAPARIAPASTLVSSTLRRCMQEVIYIKIISSKYLFRAKTEIKAAAAAAAYGANALKIQ